MTKRGGKNSVDEIHAATTVVLLEMLREMPLVHLLRLIVSVRWGSLGRALAAQHSSARAQLNRRRA